MVATDTNINPKEISLRKFMFLICNFYLLLLYDQSIFAQSFSSSNLPIIVITQHGKNINNAWVNEVIVEMGVIYNGPGQRNYIGNAYNNYRGNISCKIQGSSSIGLIKKSYRISTLNAFNQQTDVSLLGMPSHEDWILKALYQDKSLLRDDLSYRIYNQMGHYSSRSKFFELVVDGEYRGVYQLLEKIRRDDYRVNISKLLPQDVSGDYLSGGYIISLDKFTAVDKGWYSKYTSNQFKDSANYFLYYYPPADSMQQVQRDYIHNYIDQFEDALVGPNFKDPNTGYRKYIDVSTFIDFLIVNELSKNVDGYRASTFLYKDKGSGGNGKLHAGPLWDFNIAWGNCEFNGGSQPASGWQYQAWSNVNFVPFWWKQFMLDATFKDQLRCRYVTLRNSILSESALFSYVDGMAGELEESQKRNFEKWPIMGTVVSPNPSPVPTTYSGEISYLKYWIRERLKFMDNNVPGNCAGVGLGKEQNPGLGVNSFPNPFMNTLNVSYHSDDKAKIKIELLTILGEHVLPVLEKEKPAGNYEAELNTENIKPGTYILKISLNNLISNQKIVKTGS